MKCWTKLENRISIDDENLSMSNLKNLNFLNMLILHIITIKTFKFITVLEGLFYNLCKYRFFLQFLVKFIRLQDVSSVHVYLPS